MTIASSCSLRRDTLSPLSLVESYARVWWVVLYMGHRQTPSIIVNCRREERERRKRETPAMSSTLLKEQRRRVPCVNVCGTCAHSQQVFTVQYVCVHAADLRPRETALRGGLSSLSFSLTRPGPGKAKVACVQS